MTETIRPTETTGSDRVVQAEPGSEIVQFLEIVYGGSKTGNLILFDAASKTHVPFDIVNRVEISRRATELAAAANVFFGIGLHDPITTETRTRKSETVIALPGFWLDVDIKSGVHAEADLPATDADAQSFLDSLKLKPSLLVHSGGGIHAYFLFQEPLLIVDEEGRALARKLSKAFGSYAREQAALKGWRLDDVSDLARCLRLPGTWNRKNADAPKLVKIIEHREGLRYSPEEFSEFVKHEPVRSVTSQSSTGKLDVIPQGMRNTELTKRAGMLNRVGLDQDGIVEGLLEINRKRCLPPLSEDEVRGIAISVSRYQNQSKVAESDLELTDMGNARRLVSRHGSRLRYCTNWKSWLVWDGRRWNMDESLEIERLAKETIMSIYAEAKACGDNSRSQALGRHALQSQSSGKIRAMIEVAKSEPEMAVLPDDLDRDHFMLNCENGTLELLTGKLIAHEPNQLMTKLAPVKFEPAAECPQFMKFIDQIFRSDTDLIRYVQKVIGYSLSGDISEQCFFYLYGLGANGKSVFLETIRNLVGDYGKQTEFTTFLSRQNDAARNDLAMLKGARFVTAPEVDSGKELSESVIKQVTGGEPLSARFLFKEFFEFKPEFKLFIAANHKLKLKNQDHGIWRRVKLIPFGVTIPEPDRDKHLVEKLRSEMSGILNWALEGFRLWKQEGLTAPAAVESATQDYKLDMDTVGEFIAQRCDLQPNAVESIGKLYTAYVVWCEQSKEKPLGKINFSELIMQRGITKKRTNASWLWSGIMLKSS